MLYLLQMCIINSVRGYSNSYLVENNNVLSQTFNRLSLCQGRVSRLDGGGGGLIANLVCSNDLEILSSIRNSL